MKVTMSHSAEAAIRTVAAAAITGSVVLLGSTITAVAFPWGAAPFRSSPGTGLSYLAGQRIDVPPDLYAGAEASLLLFARSSCGACEAAQPAFAALMNAATTSQVQVRLILQTEGGSNATDNRLIAGLGLASDQVRHLEFKRLRLKRVPAVALVGRDGKISRFAEGIPEGRALITLIDALRDVAEPARVTRQ
jgi:hypothetical protein